MNITSLLQEAPSRDRTRRITQPWEEGASSKPVAAIADDRPSSLGSPSNPASNDFGTSGVVAANGQYQQPHGHRSFQNSAEPGYSSVTSSQGHPHPQYSPFSYYQKHTERDTERVAHHSNPPSDYVDVETAERSKKLGYDRHGQSQSAPLSALHSPANRQLQFSEHNGERHSPRLPPLPGMPSQVVSAPATIPPPPRTPSPVLDAVHLGSYVYPNLPFPIPPSALPYNRRTTMTVLVPPSLLPHHHIAQLTKDTVYADSRANKLWGGVPRSDTRKVYTDDSDVVFAALHSGAVSDDPTLFSAGKTLRLALRLYPAPETGRYSGGLGAAGITSSSWGNAHEGCAYTILDATWLRRQSTTSYTRQTRKARMFEYAQRRAMVMDSQDPLSLDAAHSAKSRPAASISQDTLPLRHVMDPIEEEMGSLCLVGGWERAIGVKYDPMTLYLMLFARKMILSINPAKRRKVESTSKPVVEKPARHRELVLEGPGQISERLILSPVIYESLGNRNGDMEVDQAESSDAPEATIRYNLSREVRKSPEEVQGEAKADADYATLAKGVHFSVETIQKETSRDPDNTLWNRSLLRPNLGPDDITCLPNSIEVAGESYPIASWRWKGEPGEASRPATGKPAFAGRLKQRRAKKEAKKLKVEKKQDESAEVVVTPVSPKATIDAENGAKPKEPAQRAPRDDAKTSVPDVAADVEGSKAAQTVAEDDKEEGELD